MAEKWSVSPDGTVWSFQLYKGAKLHRGYGEVTAEDSSTPLTGERLLKTILAVVSGEKTRAEITDYRRATDIYVTGPVT